MSIKLDYTNSTTYFEDGLDYHGQLKRTLYILSHKVLYTLYYEGVVLSTRYFFSDQISYLMVLYISPLLVRSNKHGKDLLLYVTVSNHGLYVPYG